MLKCPKCGTDMESKGQLDDGNGVELLITQCPKCKNIEFKNKQANSWFRLDYP